MDYEQLKQDPRALIIAEAGINHDGDLDKALRMVDVAARAGADYVKFQNFRAGDLVLPDAPMSSYIESAARTGEGFRDVLARLELSVEATSRIAERCRERGIRFLSTAFDEDSFMLLVELRIDVVKVASGDLTNLPFLGFLAGAGLPMILSTGMASLGEVEQAVETVAGRHGNDRIVLLHCISWYPADFEDVSLRYMDTLRSAFGFPVGYSDHTLGTSVSVAARALGAVCIEKHFTLDRSAWGPDHAASIEAQDLERLVREVREVEQALGRGGGRKLGAREIGQRTVHRRSLVTRCGIRPGETLTAGNLTIKRPGNGLPPRMWETVLGRKAARAIEPDALLQWEDIAF